MTTISCRTGQLTFGPGYPLMLTNDQPRIQDQNTKVLKELKEGRMDMLIALARWGQQVGTDMAAVLLTHPEIDEATWLPRVARAIHDEIGCPVGLDTQNPEALAAGLQALQPYKAIHWTVTAEREVLEALLPIDQKYGAVVCGMPLGHYSRAVPMTAEGRLAEARIIVEACLEVGIPQEDIMIDAVCIAAATMEPDSFRIACETVQLIHDELGVTTQLGIGNAGHGMPDQTWFDLAHLIAAMPYHLDTALVNPATKGLVECVRAMDFMLGIDETGRRYLQYWRDHRTSPEYFWDYQRLIGQHPTK